MQNKNYWRTSDLLTAGFLSASGFQIEEIERARPKSFFCLEPSPDLTHAVDAYRRREGRVEPQEFWFHYQSLKKRILDGRDAELDQNL